MVTGIALKETDVGYEIGLQHSISPPFNYTAVDLNIVNIYITVGKRLSMYLNRYLA